MSHARIFLLVKAKGAGLATGWASAQAGRNTPCLAILGGVLSEPRRGPHLFHTSQSLLCLVLQHHFRSQEGVGTPGRGSGVALEGREVQSTLPFRGARTQASGMGWGWAFPQSTVPTAVMDRVSLAGTGWAAVHKAAEGARAHICSVNSKCVK